MCIREARPEDAPAAAALITLAYRVEDFFIDGDRTTAADVIDRMALGTFLLLEDAGGLTGVVFVQTRGTTGYFAMLSVHPDRQRSGAGSRLIDAAEDWCRRAGCREIEIEVVSLRTELLPYYEHRGYVRRGTKPFADAHKSRMSCEFLILAKPL